MSFWTARRSHTVELTARGRPAAGLGGTADVVAYAEQRGVRVVQVNPIDGSITEPQPPAPGTGARRPPRRSGRSGDRRRGRAGAPRGRSARRASAAGCVWRGAGA